MAAPSEGNKLLPDIPLGLVGGAIHGCGLSPSSEGGLFCPFRQGQKLKKTSTKVFVNVFLTFWLVLDLTPFGWSRS